MKILSGAVVFVVGLAITFAVLALGCGQSASLTSADALRTCPEFSKFPPPQQDQLCAYKDQTNDAVQNAAYKFDRIAGATNPAPYSYKGHKTSVFVVEQPNTGSLVFTENDGVLVNNSTPNLFRVSTGQQGTAAFCEARIDRSTQTVTMYCLNGALLSIYR